MPSAYQRPLILGGLVTRLGTITIAAGYESNVGTDSVFRFPVRPPEHHINWTKAPLLLVLDPPDAGLIDEKSGLQMWRATVPILGMAASSANGSDALNSLLGDVQKCLMTDRTLGGAAPSLIDLRILRAGLLEDLTKPHAGFELTIRVDYEHSDVAP